MQAARNNKEYSPSQDFLRVATATPEVAIADVDTNLARISELYSQASQQNVCLIVFPELCLTGYSIQDLVRQSSLLEAAKNSLLEFAKSTKNINTAAIIGLPICVGNAIYNCAAFVADGQIKGIIPKQNLPTYNEFYEKRWYQSWDKEQNIQIKLNQFETTFGTNQLFKIGDQLIGVEICEDLWVPEPPNINLVKNGATIIANPSASPEAVAKSNYRRELVSNTAARLSVGYVYAGADMSESTAEIVMSGHAIISELGTTLAEREPFQLCSRLQIADIDTQHIIHERQKTTNFPNNFDINPTQTLITCNQCNLSRHIDYSPFIPKNDQDEITNRLDTILNIQASGLVMRLKKSGTNKIVIGLSGGLDSTLALLVAIKAANILKVKPGEIIHTLTMPSHASSDRTQNNAKNLAFNLNIINEKIIISKLSQSQLHALNHNNQQDITYENTQARIRQALIFNKANQLNGLALGTGDLSEIALGWCTYNGDHMSHYNVNSSIPKTLVRSLVRHAANYVNTDAKQILLDIIDTPVSPELTGDGNDISQTTEDIVGPYELHDFFLYHFIRWMESPQKIAYLAKIAFINKYSNKEVDKWLGVFLKRFYKNQWKRQAMPDGAKVGINLSPKGDWRMPPEAELV
ncbi:NAD(+) synthase [Candidatus Saccharibacteria bacterium HGW-Saccharibacteria-1]|jgi:NAD+ synthase (glutamine-hydrolysing)|nr:MAG: NAD(+) synthase [Candidatus Saccharibacteria bacterium HGW-Saccharibacteria-1]